MNTHLNLSWTCKSPLVDTLLNSFTASVHRSKRISLFTYKQHLSCIVANLEQARRHNNKLIYSRDLSNRATGKHNNVIVIDLMNWLYESGFINHRKGVKGSKTRTASEAWLSDKAALDAEKARIKLMIDENIPFIKLYVTDKKDGKKTRTALSLPNKPAAIKKLNKPALSHNKLWLDNEARLITGEYLNPFVHRSFSKDLSLGGRFYFPSQTMNKAQRKDILINGELTAELDYKAIHFNLLYAEKGIQFSGDPYKTNGYDRSTIKLAMISFMNAENRPSWCANITRSGNENATEATRGFIAGIPSGTKGKDLAYAIDERHSQIADLFHAKDIGIRLQNKDSQIMSLCLLECAKRQIAVLPYHDGIRCPQSDTQAVYEIMKDAYKQVTGFDIVVDID